MTTVHDIALYVLIFDLGFLAGYMLKVWMVKREKRKQNNSKQNGIRQ